MKLTNKQKCFNIQIEIDDLVKTFTKDNVPHIPSSGFIVRYKSVSKVEVDVQVSNRKFSYGLPAIKSRVSKSILDEYEQALEAAKNLSLDDVYVDFSERSETSRTTWAEKLANFNINSLFTSKEDAEIACKVETDAHDKIYKAGDDQFNCGYCNKATDNSNKVDRELIFRTRDSWGNRCVGRRVKHYCSLTCGGNDQMSHEG